MAVKLLISGLANSGKTSLTKDLKDVLVISHDGKNYPYKTPHVLVTTFDTTAELIELITEKMVIYKERFGKYPSTVVFDSVSKIFDTLNDSCNRRFTGFKIYSELNSEVTAFTYFIQNSLVASDINVVIISHAIYDSEETKYNLVGKGDFQKRGGFLADVDQAIFIETKANKRILHFRSTKFPARTLLESDPESMPVEDFNLTDYLSVLNQNHSSVEEFSL
jgi:hypothetical protein